MFGLVVCVFVFVAAEAVLALLGVRASNFGRDPYVGFSRSVPHFVPDPDAGRAGMLVTAENKRRVLNVQRFSARKEGTFRIFCLGGSTTYGHPYTDSTSFSGWLRAMLPKADPTRRWEVINCGGISYASYREARLMEELIQYEPDLFIVLSAHNEFLEQRTYSGIIAMPEALRGLGVVLGRTRVYSAMKRGVERLRGVPDFAARPANVLAENPEAILDRTVGPQSYQRDDVQRQRIIDHYRFNLARMIDIARSVGAKVHLVSPASNLRNCAPFKSEHRPGLGPAELSRWEDLVRKALEARRGRQLGEALAFLDQAAAIDDRHADLHYLRGHLLWDLDRHGEAKTSFVRAREEDVCPLRALSPMIEATADVAAARGVSFVDFTRRIEARSLHGVPGDDWFLDHVHPTIEGHRQLALEIMDVMAREGTLRPAASWNEAAQLEVKREVEGRLTQADQATALVTLAKVLAWAGKADEAYGISLRAGTLAPDDASVLFELGKNAAHIGRRDEAIRSLRRAVELKPRFAEARSLLGTKLMEAGEAEEAIRHCREAAALRPEDPLLLLNLAEMLHRGSSGAEAETVLRQALRLSPNHAEAHNNLAWLLKERGAFTEALAHFREAVRLRPGSISPTMGLAWMLASHPDSASRDPAEAVRLGRRLAELSNYQNWMSLDTLAVAYAASGRYPEAVQTAEKAHELVRKASPPNAKEVGDRLALFQQNRPFVESKPEGPR